MGWTNKDARFPLDTSSKEKIQKYKKSSLTVNIPIITVQLWIRHCTRGETLELMQTSSQLHLGSRMWTCKSPVCAGLSWGCLQLNNWITCSCHNQQLGHIHTLTHTKPPFSSQIKLYWAVFYADLCLRNSPKLLKLGQQCAGLILNLQ